MPRVQPPSIPLGDKAGVEKTLALSEQEELVKTRISLKVENADMATLIKQVQGVLPEAKVIEVRGDTPVRLSFGVKDVLMGQVLQSAAWQAGCELQLLPGKLLIAPKAKLSPEEDKEKFSYVNDGHLYTVSRLNDQFVHSLVDAVRKQAAAREGATGVAEVLYGNMGPEEQAMLQRLGRWATYGFPKAPPRVTLNPDTKVSVRDTPHGFTLDIDPGLKSSPGESRQGLAFFYVGK